MKADPPARTATRLALRCDGDDEVGAGHVARCLPLAGAFVRRGWEPVFVGRFDGLARWMLDRAQIADQPAQRGPAGIDAADWSAAVVDGYRFDETHLCTLARALPVAFIAEAARCPDAGVHLDYHPQQATAVVPGSPNRLVGPRYAPVDPRFCAIRRDRADVRAALVTVGGSSSARTLAAPAVDALRAAFPDARIWVASGAAVPAVSGVTMLSFPGSLLDVLGDVDIAVSAAGMTAYELAAAGVPTVLVAAADNQRRVIDGFAKAQAALTVGDGDLAAHLTGVVERLRDPSLRRALSHASRRLVDGHGAERAAAALEHRWQVRAGGGAARRSHGPP